MLNFTPESVTVDVNEWTLLASGFERRSFTPESALGSIEVVRIDPQLYRFRVHYLPGDAISTVQWRDRLPGTVGFVNANFFTPEFYALGLLVADGIVYGQPYVDRGGMFAVQGDQISLRSNITDPYRGERIDQAVQAFPMLVLNGETVYRPTSAERLTRRTVIALDDRGRVLLMATPGFGMTLETLSVLLPQTDMGIVTALNLDGGRSTMLFYHPSPAASPYLLGSVDRVPAVLAIYPRP